MHILCIYIFVYQPSHTSFLLQILFLIMLQDAVILDYLSFINFDLSLFWSLVQSNLRPLETCYYTVLPRHKCWFIVGKTLTIISIALTTRRQSKQFSSEVLAHVLHTSSSFGERFEAHYAGSTGNNDVIEAYL